MPIDNHQVVLAERPTDAIIPGTTFAQKITPAPTEADLEEGDLLVEVLYLSLDPAMRGWLSSESARRPVSRKISYLTKNSLQMSALTSLPSRSVPSCALLVPAV